MPLGQIIGGEDWLGRSLILNCSAKSSEPSRLMERGDHIPRLQEVFLRLDCKSQA